VRTKEWIPAVIVVATFLAIIVNMWWVSTQRAEQDQARPTATPFDAQTVETGRAIYVATCAPCHGADGVGAPGWQQPNPDGSHLPPAHDGTGHTWHHGDGYLFRIIRDGATTRTIPNVPPAPANMPAFSQRLSPEEIKAVVAYIKTLWTAEQRDAQAEISTHDPFPRF